MILRLRPKAARAKPSAEPKRPRGRRSAAPEPVLAPLAPGQYEIAPEVVVLSAPQSPAALAITEAATATIARHVEQGRRGLALCGASPGVGVTFMAANLGAALAQSGVSTIIVEANLRRPGLDRFLRPSRVDPGVLQFVEDEGFSIDEIVHEEVLPNLSVVYAGGTAPDPQALLAGDRFQALLRDCLRSYECTLVDTSAANQGSDPMIVAALIGYAAIVARRGESYMDDVELLRAQLVTDGAQVTGAILNAV